jgi:hypothetical protein
MGILWLMKEHHVYNMLRQQLDAKREDMLLELDGYIARWCCRHGSRLVLVLVLGPLLSRRSCVPSRVYLSSFFSLR